MCSSTKYESGLRSVACGVSLKAMTSAVDRSQFRDTFDDRAVVVTDLPAGRARDLAEQVRTAGATGDASLRTRQEFDALFDLLVAEFGAAAGSLTLVDTGTGADTAAGGIVRAYRDASLGKDEFFAHAMYGAHVTGWTGDRFPKQPVQSSGTARLAVSRIDPADPRHIPPVGGDPLFTTPAFSLVNSGNRTLYAPKPSWKIRLDVGGSEDRIVGMDTLNLKSMYNDPSQMREALAWRLFGRAGVPASRQTYARFGIDAVYRGLFSVTEEVDRRFLRDRFGANFRGNLYKAGCGDLGCATLEHRVDGSGDDSGRQYMSTQLDDQTYRLRTNENDPSANTFEDLAEFIRTINAVAIPGDDGRFDSDPYRTSVEQIMNVRSFLRWAGVNILLGSWDNYFATPSNYFLYNSGRLAAPRGFMASPYFTFIPWDYDNSFGITYVDTQWQHTDIVNWPDSTRVYWNNRGVSKIPLVQNLLRNTTLLRYYLDHLEHLLDTDINPAAILAVIDPGGDGLWRRVRTAAYLESDTPHGRAHTGRQFSNHQVHLNGERQHELRDGNRMIEGVYHYLVMRYDSARAQLARLRRNHPTGSSNATFTGTLEPLP
jgi:hypothetical protein